MTRRAFDVGQIWEAFAPDLDLWFEFRLLSVVTVRGRKVWIAEKMRRSGPLEFMDVVTFDSKGRSLLQDLTGPTYFLKDKI